MVLVGRLNKTHTWGAVHAMGGEQTRCNHAGNSKASSAKLKVWRCRILTDAVSLGRSIITVAERAMSGAKGTAIQHADNESSRYWGNENPLKSRLKG